MNDLIECRKLNADNLEDLRELFVACGKSVSKSDLSRKYSTESFENEYVGYLAYDKLEQKAVAFYGVLPVIAEFKGEQVRVAQSADTVTHPNYRKRGLFIKLALLTVDLCKSLNIKVLFGIPNENSLHGFVKHLDWEIKDYYLVYEKKIFTLPINYFLHKYRLFTKLYYHYTRLLKRIIFGNDVFFSELERTAEEFQIRDSELYHKYKIGPGVYEVSNADFKLLFSVHKYIKLGSGHGLNNTPLSIRRKLIFFAVLSGSHKIVFQQLSEGVPNSVIEFLMSGVTPQRGLPLIQKNIDGDKKYDSKLMVRFLDFDTF